MSHSRSHHWHRSDDVSVASFQGLSSNVYCILSYPPISLYAASLRVQAALVSCVALLIRVQDDWLVSICCQILAVVLLTQAALLASCAGRSTVDALDAVVWLYPYLIMLIPPYILKRHHPTTALQRQPACIVHPKTLHFSSRRAALAFISMLPASQKVGRWNWIDQFMPDNNRRRMWQEDLVACEANLITRVSNERDKPSAARDHLREADVALKGIHFTGHLFAYRRAVGLW